MHHRAVAAASAAASAIACRPLSSAQGQTNPSGNHRGSVEALQTRRSQAGHSEPSHPGRPQCPAPRPQPEPPWRRAWSPHGPRTTPAMRKVTVSRYMAMPWSGASRSTCRHASESRPSPQRWPQPALVAGEGRRDVAVRAGRSAQQGRAVPPIRMAVKSGPCLRPGEAPQTRNAPGGGGRAHGRLSSSSKK